MKQLSLKYRSIHYQPRQERTHYHSMHILTMTVLIYYCWVHRPLSTERRILSEFMPVISQPPKHDVCKYYLDILNGVIKDLGLNHIFIHADQDVYAKLVQITWKHGDLYKKHIVLFGNFHVLKVRQRSIYKSMDS